MPSTRAIVFDLDDTLYPEQAFVFSGYEAVARVFARRLGMSADSLVRRMRDLFGTPDRGRVFDVIVAEADAERGYRIVFIDYRQNSHLK